MASPLSSFNFQSTEWLSHCRLSTAKLPYLNLLSSFSFKTSLFLFIVQFQLQNFPILIYCPVSTPKLLYLDLLSSFSFKTSLFWFIVQFQLQNFLIWIYCIQVQSPNQHKEFIKNKVQVSVKFISVGVPEFWTKRKETSILKLGHQKKEVSLCNRL